MQTSFCLNQCPSSSWPAAASLALLLLMFQPSSLLAQKDDFNDGNDDGWTRFDPRGMLGAGPAASWSFPNGNSYRIEVPVRAELNIAGQGRAASIIESQAYTDFYVEVDIIDWDESSVQTAGIAARMKDTDPGLGTLDGYFLNYDFGSGRDLSISLITDEAPVVSQLEDTTGGVDNYDFESGKDYRLVFIGQGAQLEGRIYELPVTDEPVVVITATDATYSQGVCGLITADSASAETIADVTFDNYRAGPGPDRPLFASDPPLIENMDPANRSTFLGGISRLSFDVRTADPNTIGFDDIKVLVNGLDVSGSLTITGEPAHRTVSWDGIESDRLYTVQITASDDQGRTTVETLAFDTLNPATARMIEAEDYNYGLSGGLPLIKVCNPTEQPPTADSGGGFQDNPPPSGFESGDGGLQVNGDGVGYLDLAGIREVDFHDMSTTIGEPEINNYRLCNPVGVEKTTDAVRQKYLDLSIPDWDQDVFDVEAGEWLNYSRTFPEGHYRILLRAASSAHQEVELSLVTGNAGQPGQDTQTLGTFVVPDTGPYHEYVDLTDPASGDPVTVALSGVETLRLTALSAAGNLRLNYLLVVQGEVAIDLENPRVAGGDFLFDLGTANGVAYQVQTKAALADAWQNAQEIAGDGSLATVTLPVAGESLFVRVISP